MGWLSFAEQPVTFTIVIGVLVEVLVILQAAYKQIFSHPLSKYPGPALGFLTTYRRAFIELVLGKSWHKELQQLHTKYGPIVRVGPNELHFSEPQAYHDIYNDSNRWEKDESLYHSLASPDSLFGTLTYEDAKERRDALNKLFSKSAVQRCSRLVQEKVDELCEVFTTSAKADHLADLTWAFRCLSLDIMTSLCLGKSFEAIHARGFKAPIVVAMDARLQALASLRHFSWYGDLLRLLRRASSGLVDLQMFIRQQIQDLTTDRHKLNDLPHDYTIYHTLMDPKMTTRGEELPEDVIYEEAMSLMYAGTDTVGIALMITFYHLLQDSTSIARVKDEVKSIWPDLKSPAPAAKELEALPYFNACLKEGLRLAVGVASPLPRITPNGGAVIAGEKIPEDTIVGTDALCVHFNEDIFPDAGTFKPSRFIDDAALDGWLVTFSRGPRSCLGIDLAWTELRLTLASVVRRFDLKLDASSHKQLAFRDRYLPDFQGPHVVARLTLSPS